MGTKAEMVRELIKNRGNKKLDDLVEPAMKKTGLSKALARTYLKNNWSKATEKPAAKKAKTETHAKTTSSKKS